MTIQVPLLMFTLALKAMTATTARPAAEGPAREPAAAMLKFDNVRLLVSRFDETLAFYRDVLDLKLTWGAPGENYASFAFPGGGQLALFRRALMAEAVGAAAWPATRHEQDTAAIILSVDDLDTIYKELQDKGVQFTSTPQDRREWGIRAVHFRDPDGNLIEIFSALKK